MTRVHWTDEQRARHATIPQRITWTDDALLDALRSVAGSEGKCTQPVYYRVYLENKTLPSPRTYRMRFGSWANALDAAGLPTYHPKPYANRIPEETMWGALVECAEEIGHIPTVAEYDAWALLSHDRPCCSLVRERLGGWGEVLRVLSEPAAA